MAIAATIEFNAPSLESATKPKIMRPKIIPMSMTADKMDPTEGLALS